MTPIRTTDKDGIAGILATGRPAGYWMAQSEAFPRIWTGVVADGRRAVRKLGTLGEVLEWLHRKAGILRDTRVRKMRKRGIEVPRVMKEKQKAGQLERAMEMKRMRDEEGLRAKEISARTGTHINTVYMLLKIADGKEVGG